MTACQLGLARTPLRECPEASQATNLVLPHKSRIAYAQVELEVDSVISIQTTPLINPLMPQSTNYDTSKTPKTGDTAIEAQREAARLMLLQILIDLLSISF